MIRLTAQQGSSVLSLSMPNPQAAVICTFKRDEQIIVSLESITLAAPVGGGSLVVVGGTIAIMVRESYVAIAATIAKRRMDRERELEWKVPMEETKEP